MCRYLYIYSHVYKYLPTPTYMLAYMHAYIDMNNYPSYTQGAR